MKTLLRSSGVQPAQTQRLRSLLTALASCAVFVGFVQVLPAQVTFSDDFTDGNDSGWERYNALAPLGLNATYSFPNGGYRIQTTYTTGVPQNPGRSGTVRPEIYTDFYVTVDIVNWNDALPQSIGLLARIGTPGLQTTTGYFFTWDRGNPTSQTAGDVDLGSLAGEVPTGFTLTGDAIHFQTGHSYRMVFIGKGTALEGRVYELPNTTTPVVVVQANDSLYSSGKSGLVVFDNSQGQNQTDATFDNYYASDIEPPRLALVDYSFGDYAVSWPEGNQFILQGASTLAPNGWEDLAPTSTTAGTHFYDFTPGTTPGQRFFRLIRR